MGVTAEVEEYLWVDSEEVKVEVDMAMGECLSEESVVEVKEEVDMAVVECLLEEAEEVRGEGDMAAVEYLSEE